MIGLCIFFASLLSVPQEFSFKNQLAVPFFGEKEELSGEFDKEASQNFCSGFVNSELELINKLEDHYYQALEKSGEAKIPRVFHVIWVGFQPFPGASIKKLKQWKKLHPEWKFKFWTDSTLHHSPLKTMERHFISELPLEETRNSLRRTEHLQEISNLLKYEILFQEGGVYLDHDVECLRSIDSLLQFDFFAALEPLHVNSYDRSLLSVGSFLFGAVPRSNILKHTLSKVTENWHKISLAYPQANSFFSDIRSIARTSIPFTQSVLEHFSDHSTQILPPLSFSVKQRSDWEELLKKDLQGRFIYADHKWDNAWDKKNLDAQFICKMVSRRLTSMESLLNIQLISCCGFVFLLFFLRKRIARPLSKDFVP